MPDSLLQIPPPKHTKFKFISVRLSIITVLILQLIKRRSIPAFIFLSLGSQTTRLPIKNTTVVLSVLYISTLPSIIRFGSKYFHHARQATYI